MSFDKYIEEILQKEVSDVIDKQGYFLETEFCNMVCKKYNLSAYTVQGILRKVYSTMYLTKRHATNEIKQYYDLQQIKGFPIVYLVNSKK